MADVLTPIYQFTQPEVGGSDDTWGDKLNANWAKIDGLLQSANLTESGFFGATTTNLGTGLRIAGGSAVLEFRETDITLPNGVYRWQANAGLFRLTVNTAAAGDFSTTVEAMTASSGGITFGVPITSHLKISNTGPALMLEESDQVAPAGQYRHIVSVDTLFCQRALTADFATSKTIWSYDGATGGPFTLGGSLEVGGTGGIKMDGTSPVLWFHDSDGAVATRNFNIAANNGTMRIIKSDDVNATGTQMVVMDETSFSVPILCKLGSGGNLVEIGNTASAFIDFKRTGSPNIIRVPDGASLRVQNMTGTSWATVSTASGWVAGTSDIRLKDNVEDIGYGLDTVMALRAVQFDRKADGVHDLGLVSQEVQLIVPEVIEEAPGEDGEGTTYLFLRKDGLVPVLIKAVQELAARVETLEGA